MLKLRQDNVHQTLIDCFRIAGDGKLAQVNFDDGSGLCRSRLERQTNLTRAARIVAYIDNRMPNFAKNYYRFMFGGGDVYEYYCGLSLFIQEVITELLEGKRRGLIYESVE